MKKLFTLALATVFLLVGCGDTFVSSSDNTPTPPSLSKKVRTNNGLAKGKIKNQALQLVGDSTTVYLAWKVSDIQTSSIFNFVLTEELDAAGEVIWIFTDPNTTETFYGFTEAGSPQNGQWETGDIVVTLYLPGQAGLTETSVSVSRVDADGVVQETSDTTEPQRGDFFQDLFEFTLPDVTWKKGKSSDRLRLDIHVRDHWMGVGGRHVTKFLIGSDSTKVQTAITFKGSPLNTL